MKNNWQKLARELGIEDFKIDEWKKKSFNETKTAEDIIIEILTEWRMNHGAASTAAVLVRHLNSIKWKNVAGTVNGYQYTIHQH